MKVGYRRTVAILAIVLIATAAATHWAARRHRPVPTPVAVPVAAAIDAPPQPGAIPLYGDKTPGRATDENWSINSTHDYNVRNVTRPTLTPVLPDPAKATGTAVVVAPGGSFVSLEMSHEGWQVAHALADRGIAAFVLKYRVLSTPRDNKAAGLFIWQKIRPALVDTDRMPALTDPAATEDSLAALRMVRANAAKWRVNPARVGMIGFSAGAMVSLAAAIAAKPGEGPTFLGYIYGPQARIVVPDTAPPMFDAIALDDPLFAARGFPIAQAWSATGRPVEIHGYQKGGHGFGLGVPGTSTTLMLDEFVAWLAMQGLLARKDATRQ